MKLIETLLSIDGETQHLSYHQKRFDKSFTDLFSRTNAPKLEDHIAPPSEGTYRIRLIYDKDSIDVGYHLYTPVYQKDFILLEADFSYSYKFLDRHHFEKLKKQYPDKEIIFHQNGLITDTTIANIACFIDNQWVTPARPLLQGTTRARLLDTNILITENITVKAFKNAKKFALMNALTDFYEVKNATIVDPII